MLEFVIFYAAEACLCSVLCVVTTLNTVSVFKADYSPEDGDGIFSETLVSTYEFTRSHDTNEHYCLLYRHENLRSNINYGRKISRTETTWKIIYA
jgi:hypothetical protein